MNATSVPDGGIDPRIRARRVEVIREQGRRRLRILFAAVCALCLAGFAWLLVQSPLLDVDRVEVVGAHRVRAADVATVARVRHGSALLTLERGPIEKRVASIPWVAEVNVSKDLPGTVRIVVRERVPVAWVPVVPASAQRRPLALVDATGRVLADVVAPPAGLPELVGLAPVPRPGKWVSGALLAVETRVPTELRVLVAAYVSGPAGFSLRLVPGTPAAEIRLGSGAQLTAKIDAALAVLRSLGGQHVNYVDVSVPSTPATG